MVGFIGNIGPWELVFILLVALIVVGPGKLPEVARSLGKAVNQFQKTTSGVKREFQEAIKIDTEPSSASQINIKPEVKKTGDTADETNDSSEPEVKNSESTADKSNYNNETEVSDGSDGSNENNNRD